jgi:hypothetical protein
MASITKVAKCEILAFIKKREIVTCYDLMQTFYYTYHYACKKLSLLKRQGLVVDMGNTPSTYRGQWCLTDKGHEKLRFLQARAQSEMGKSQDVVAWEGRINQLEKENAEMQRRLSQLTKEKLELQNRISKLRKANYELGA